MVELIVAEMTVAEMTTPRPALTTTATAAPTRHSCRAHAKCCNRDQYDESIGSHCTDSLQIALHFTVHFKQTLRGDLSASNPPQRHL
jgi:hypothetical protein